jgi:hypothetical protein
MILLILVVALVVMMFWQPQFSCNYRPEPEPRIEPDKTYKPTRIKRYIRYIDRMMREGHYDIAADLLARTKYSKVDLPWECWKEQVQSERARIEREAKQLSNLKSLESILDS